MCPPAESLFFCSMFALLTSFEHMFQVFLPLFRLFGDIIFFLPTLNNVLVCRYITLEVKNILLESVSHHILPQMLNSPFLQHAADLVKDYLKFMDDHLKESADLTCLAYRHRTYSKVSRCPFYCSPVASAILHGIHVKKHIVELIYAPSIINKNRKIQE